MLHDQAVESKQADPFAAPHRFFGCSQASLHWKPLQALKEFFLLQIRKRRLNDESNIPKNSDDKPWTYSIFVQKALFAGLILLFPSFM